jgi:hypothetical protein
VVSGSLEESAVEMERTIEIDGVLEIEGALGEFGTLSVDTGNMVDQLVTNLDD